jgi:coatomer subunit gamma
MSAFGTFTFQSKKEEESGLSSYYNNKTTIIQEARVFNESPISPRKCRALLTRIVYLLYVGETFGTEEATTLFFGTTKLFQHKDVSQAVVGLNVFIIQPYRVRCGKWSI